MLTNPTITIETYILNTQRAKNHVNTEKKKTKKLTLLHVETTKNLRQQSQTSIRFTYVWK